MRYNLNPKVSGCNVMNGLTAREVRSVFALAGVFASRMMGLFLIMPVIALYGRQLQGSTPELVGMAIGIYGLMQSILQIPLGILSDRVPRKPLIISGMLIFAAGAAVSALSHSIHGVILGRALQGAGAISAVAMALVADLTRDEHRTKAMAVIGMTIGLSFSVAFIVSPILAGWGGLAAVFWTTALLAVLGALICAVFVPSPQVHTIYKAPNRSSFGSLLFQPHLLRINIGVLFMHAVMASVWMVMPLLLVQQGHLPLAHHAWVYLPVMLLGFVGSVPFIIIAEKKFYLRSMMAVAVLVMMTGLGIAGGIHQGLWPLVVGLFLYFLAFNLLEALLPSVVSKLAPAGARGSAMGIFSTFQFLGPAVGGMLGGFLLVHHISTAEVIALAILPLLVWFVILATMREIRPLRSYILHFSAQNPEEISKILLEVGQVSGVVETLYDAEQNRAYMKADAQSFKPESLQGLPVTAFVGS